MQMEAYKRECACTSVSVHACMHVCMLRACIRETERLTLGWVFFESERTRARGVVAKEAWGDYKDLAL